MDLERPKVSTVSMEWIEKDQLVYSGNSNFAKMLKDTEGLDQGNYVYYGNGFLEKNAMERESGPPIKNIRKVPRKVGSCHVGNRQAKMMSVDERPNSKK
ncbi:hypothetical protein Hanom_Chr00s002169g01692841 [Helianthus anomalus]